MRMVHYFGLRFLCEEETFNQQWWRLFNLDERTWDAIWRLARGILGGERHWCDSFIYEAVICPLVDVLDSTEVFIQKIDGFVRVVDGQVVASAILELDSSGWTSILDCYFNPTNYIIEPHDESSNSDDEEAVEARAKRERKRNLISEAWEVYRVGVMNRDLGPFRRLLHSTNNWLIAASVVHVVDIGERLYAIIHYLE